MASGDNITFKLDGVEVGYIKKSMKMFFLNSSTLDFDNMKPLLDYVKGVMQDYNIVIFQINHVGISFPFLEAMASYIRIHRFLDVAYLDPI